MTIVISMWSPAAVIEAITLRSLTPMQFTAWCTVFGSFALFLTALATGKTGKLLSYTFHDHLKLLILSLLGFGGYQTLKYTAYTMVPIPQANILQYSYPVFIVIFAMPVLKQPITMTKIISIVMGFTGAVIILSGGSLVTIEWDYLGGYTIALCAGASFGLFSTFAAKASFESLSFMFFLQLYSAVIIIFMLFLTGSLAFPATMTEIEGVFYAGVIANVIGVILLISAQQLTNDVSYISGSLYLVPFLSLYAFRIFLDYPIPFYAFMGLIFIVGGMVYHTIRSHAKMNATNSI
ncbi:MAG: DMT family transporter [Candidatus Latescibacteria bacterium]|nr:DMT family transporter [Candidatus Latescibacterota bacterium]